MATKPQPGRYRLYGRGNKLLYTGSSKNIQQRLKDRYYGRGDQRTVPNQRELAGKVAKVDIDYDPNVWDNRERERREKRGLPYNKR